MSTQDTPIQDLLREDAWARRLAVALVGPSRAEDLVQQAYLRAVEGKFAQGTNPRAWLSRVLRNGAANLHREGARRNARERAVAADERDLGTPDAIQARLEQRGLLVELLLDLPDVQRTALVLKYEQGLKAAEIAARVGCSVPTVRTRLKRGLDRVRQRLDERHDGRSEDWMQALTPLLVKRPSAAVAGLGLPAGLLWPAGLTAAAAAVFAGLTLFGNGPQRAAEAAPAPPVEVAAADSDSGAGQGPSAREAAAAAPSPPAFAAPSVGGSLFESAASMFGPRTELRVELVDESGLPVPRADVRLSAQGRTLRAQSDGAGLVTLSTRLLSYDTSVTLSASGSGERYVNTVFLAVCGELNDLGQLALTPGSTISGRLAWRDGSKLERGQVALLPAGRAPTREEALLSRLGELDSNAEAEDDGAFELRSALIGPHVLWYRDAGSTWTAGPELDLRIGDRQEALALWLDEGSVRVDTAFVVTASDGTALDEVSYRAKTDSGTTWIATRIDAARVPLARSTVGQTVVGFSAVHRERREAGRWSGRLELGDPDVELRLEPMAPLEVQLSGLVGETPAEHWLTVREPDASFVYAEAEPTTVSEGLQLSSLCAPPWEFSVEVRLPGYRTSIAGPFPGGTARVELTLEALPPLQLELTEGGRPFAAGWVEAIGRAPQGATYLYNGFPNRFSGRGERSYKTDSQGHVTLSRESEDAEFLKLWRPNQPARVVPIPDTAGQQRLRIDLGESGGVEGEVRMADGSSVRGVVVALADAAFQVRTKRVSRSGRFRFEDLPPGTWYAYRVEAVIPPDSYSTWTRNEPAPEGWEPPDRVEVRPGETARLTLVLPAPVAPPVRCALSVDDLPAAGWTARVEPLEEGLGLGDLRESRSARLGRSGDAEISATGVGPHRIVLEPPAGTGLPRLTRTVQLDASGRVLNLNVELGPLDREQLPGAATRLEGELSAPGWTWDLAPAELPSTEPQVLLPVGRATVLDRDRPLDALDIRPRRD